MDFDTRYYVELVGLNGVVSNFSQLQKPTVPEIKAFVRATLDCGPVKLKRTWASRVLAEQGINSKSISYDVAGAEGLGRFLVNVVESRNDLDLVDEWCKRCPDESDEELEAFHKRWRAYAPRRCIE